MLSDYVLDGEPLRPYGHPRGSTSVNLGIPPLAVKFPVKAEWNADDNLQGYDTSFSTDGSTIICGVRAGVFSYTHIVAKSYGIQVSRSTGDAGSLLMAWAWSEQQG